MNPIVHKLRGDCRSTYGSKLLCDPARGHFEIPFFYSRRPNGREAKHRHWKWVTCPACLEYRWPKTPEAP